MSPLGLTLLFALASALEPCSGQDAPTAEAAQPRFGKAVRSPEVCADRRITFRFHAPNASKVTLLRDGGERVPMTKAESGTWHVTTDPLPPDFYVYQFVVDGVAVADPANSLNKPIVTGGHESIAHVPGPQSLSWELNDVPRGVVHRHVYKSSTLGGETEFVVYTPPDYHLAKERKYPVLYLLHGVNEEALAWTTAGRANVIMDNLIARKQAEPMLLVMPLGYGFADPAEHVGELFHPATDHRKLLDAFSAVLLQEVIPRVEREYRVKPQRESRALAGLSMGGTQALYVGLKNPDRFAAIGSFSGAVIMFAGKFDAFLPDLKAEPNRPLPSIWTACGKEDFLFGANGVFQNWLKSKEIRFEAVETPGGHTWPVWRRNLIDFAGRLFREKADQTPRSP